MVSAAATTSRSITSALDEVGLLPRSLSMTEWVQCPIRYPSPDTFPRKVVRLRLKLVIVVSPSDNAGVSASTNASVSADMGKDSR